MAFTPATIDASAFAPVDLASMYAADQQKQANDLILQEKRDRLAARQKWNELTSSPDADLSNPAFVQRLMAIDPDQAKAVLEAQRGQQKYREEQAIKHRDAALGSAKSIASAWGNIPPEQRTEAKKREIAGNFKRAVWPLHQEFAELIDENDPDLINHIETLARSQGFVYPEEQQAEEQRKAERELQNKILLKERENELPLSVAKRQEMELQDSFTGPREQAKAKRELGGIETDLRKEYNNEARPLTKLLGHVKTAEQVLKISGKNPQAAFATIQNMQHLFDPEGVVRTEDIANMVGRQPVDDRVKSGVYKLLQGETLPEEMGRDYQEIIDTYKKVLEDAYQVKRGHYETIAKNQGLNLENIFEPHAVTAPTPAAAPVQPTQPAAPAGQAPTPQGQSLNAADVPFDVPVRSPRTGQMVIKRRAPNGEIKFEGAP